MQLLNQRITNARKALGLTQEQVAEAMNVSRQTVSHWETGRVQPDEATRRQLFALLHISDEAQPAVAGTVRKERKPYRFALMLSAAFLCGILATLIAFHVLSPRKQSADLVDGTQTDAYSFDWFQQPDENNPESAFIRMVPMESPVQLTEDAQISSQYVWRILYTIEEMNGIAFTLERFTEVFFNKEQSVMDSYERVGEECERFWPSLTFEGNSVCGYNVNRPVGGCIGYGAAMEGRDANGQPLTFKVYIPLSQEVRRAVHPEAFAQEAVAQEGKAFLRISALESPVPQVYDPVFEGDWGWKYEYVAENTTDIPFTIEVVREVFFRNDAEAFSNTYDQQCLMGWDIGCIVTADAPYWGKGGVNCLQELTGFGVAIEGVDANGNALTFSQYIPLAQEKPQE